MWEYQSYQIKSVSRDEFSPLFQQHRPVLFAQGLELDVRQVLSEQEKEALQVLGSPFKPDSKRIHLLVFKGDEFVGWSFAVQVDHERLYMVNSAVYPEHRRHGIYTRLLEIMTEEAKTAGFQIMFSTHLASNNSILIPKLKAGFVITGMEVLDAFGLTLKLSKYLNPTRDQALRYRIGEVRPDESLARHLKLVPQRD